MKGTSTGHARDRAPQGESVDLRRYANLLDQHKGSIISMYATRVGETDEQIAEWMDAETWFSADEAEEHGFADTITGNSEDTGLFDLRAFNNLPPFLASGQVACPPLACLCVEWGDVRNNYFQIPRRV